MRLATPERYEWGEWDGLGDSSVAIVAMGLALAIAGIVQTLAAPAAQPIVAVELFVSLLVPTGLATGGVWLAGHTASSDIRRRVATWVSVGIVVAVALGVWLLLYVALEGGTIRDPLSLLTTVAAIGGATGFGGAVHVTPGVETGDSTGADGATETVAASADHASATAAPTTESESAAPLAGSATARAASAAAVETDRREPGSGYDSEVASVDVPVPLPGDSRSDRESEPEPKAEPGVETAANVPATAETVLEVLQDERSRVALALLYHEVDEPQSIDDLARLVADHTDDAARAEVVALRHSTLPRLRAIRAVDWDPCADRIAASDHAVFEEGVRDAAALLESFEPGTR